MCIKVLNLETLRLILKTSIHRVTSIKTKMLQMIWNNISFRNRESLQVIIQRCIMVIYLHSMKLIKLLEPISIIGGPHHMMPIIHVPVIIILISLTMSNMIWTSLRENLSSGFPVNRVLKPVSSATETT